MKCKRKSCRRKGNVVQAIIENKSSWLHGIVDRGKRFNIEILVDKGEKMTWFEHKRRAAYTRKKQRDRERESKLRKIGCRSRIQSQN